MWRRQRLNPLDDAREYWDRHARVDPLWAVLSDETRVNRGWDLPSFMASGEREISLLFYELKQLRLEVRRDSALDFGCGVGRLTQPLGRRFHRVLGLDVSPRMIALAERLNQAPDRVQFRTNERALLDAAVGQTFDFIYSNIVLQHVHPELSRRYIGDLARLLTANGALVFQLPSHRAEATHAKPSAMPDAAYRADLRLALTTPDSTKPSTEAILAVSVHNVSTVDWSQEKFGAIRLGNHWLDSTGAMLIQDDGRADLPLLLRAGENCLTELTVHSPVETGQFILECDLVHEGVTWFKDRESATLRVPIAVTAEGARVGPSPIDGDLISVPAYSGAELDAVLGPPIAAEDPGDFPMYAVERDEVIDILRRTGCDLVHIAEDDHAKPEFVGYKYFAVKPAM